MALKNYNPTSPGRRGLVLVDKSALWQGKPEKSLVEGLSGKGGRNNKGRITARRRGGGHKRRYRQIDFKRRKFDIPATVERIEYDPNRSAFIALLKYQDGELSYIIAPQRLAPGDKVISGNQVDIKPGNAMPMKNIPVGTIIHNIEMNAIWKNKYPYGEPQLGKRGLFRSLSEKTREDDEMAMWWLLNYADGTNDLFNIADRSGYPITTLARVANKLNQAGIFD